MAAVAPPGHTTLEQEMWKELYAGLHGVQQSQLLDREGKLPFMGWVNAYHPTYEWFEWNGRLCTLLQAVADGLLLKLMVFVPPRHGKSELVSRLFTAYYLYKFPEKWVGLCSYGQELASTLSRASRDNFLASGGEMRFDSKAVTHWMTTAGGGMWSAGVGGSIYGKGGDLLVVDDPVKDAVEAGSAATQRQHQEWWQTTFRSRRQSPRTAIILVMTRWNEMDLAGWLLLRETQRARPERWRVVAWEAIKEQEAPKDSLELPMLKGVDPAQVQRVANAEWPTSVTVEPDWRKPGEALCPERFPIDDLLDTKDAMSAYFWAALYQQRPRPREGMLFKLEHFVVVEMSQVPRMRAVVRFWDYAATESAEKADPDYTAGVKMGIGVDGLPYLLDVVRGQWSSAERDLIIENTVKLDGHAVHQGREQEPGSSGKDTAFQFLAKFVGYSAFTRTASGSKFERADPLVAKAQGVKIRVVNGPWAQDAIGEFVAFGSGTTHDDVVDGASGAWNRLVQLVRLQDTSKGGATGSHSMSTY